MAYFHGILITEISDIAGGTVVPPVVPATPTVTLSADLSQPEGNGGPKLFAYTVTRSDSAGAISVGWTFAAGGTTAADYSAGVLPTGGSVALADGVTSGGFSISVNGDTDVEADELFTVTIAAPAGYALGARSSATGRIVNDDLTPGTAAFNFSLPANSGLLALIMEDF